MNMPSQNGPCPCGSGKKFKRCCGQGAPRRGGGVPGGRMQPSAAEHALHCYQQGDWAGAAHHAELALRHNTSDPLALELLAAIHLQGNAPEKALPLYERLLPMNPHDANLHSNLCMALHAMGRDEEANRHCREAIRLAPQLPEPYNNLGNIYKDRGHPLDALEWYEKAIARKTQNPLIYINAAVVCHKLMRFAEALDYSREAMRLAPEFPPAINALALSLQYSGEAEAALAQYEKLLAIAPGDAEFQNNYATCLQALGRVDEAAQQFVRIIEKSPGYMGAYINLALLHETQGDKGEAERLFRHVVEHDPGNASAHFNLGELLFERGEQEAAIQELTRALEADPTFAKAYAGMAKALSRQGNAGLAGEHIDKALELANQVGFIWACKGEVEADLGHDAEAIAAWEKALLLEPTALDTYIKYAYYYSGEGDVEGYRRVMARAEEVVGDRVQLHVSWASMAESNNCLDETQQQIDRAEALSGEQENATLLRVRASLLRRTKQFDEAYALLQRIDLARLEGKSGQSAYYFELAKVEDKRKNYREAFAAYKKANELKNEYTCRRYSEEEDRDKQRRQREFLVKNMERLLAAYDAIPDAVPQPVFIVGFPRSGTSLLEQILGSHAEIAPAGELAFMPQLAKGKVEAIIGSAMEYPDCLLDPEHPLDQLKLEALRNYYLDGVKGMGVIEAGTRWVTDKMPHNGLNVGLISLLFPRSPIIHISRHPLNPVLSAYFSNFNLGHSYTESLESTAKHYRNFMETLNYYKANLKMNFMEIHYEELVDEQERVVRELLKFIGAPWDENCMQHHKSKRLVKTASYEQVTQKVYRGSLERYKNYWEAVQPIIPILESTIEDFGYTVEPPEGD